MGSSCLDTKFSHGGSVHDEASRFCSADIPGDGLS